MYPGRVARTPRDVVEVRSEEDDVRGELLPLRAFIDTLAEEAPTCGKLSTAMMVEYATRLWEMVGAARFSIEIPYPPRVLVMIFPITTGHDMGVLRIRIP